MFLLMKIITIELPQSIQMIVIGFWGAEFIPYDDFHARIELGVDIEAQKF